jgi:hypothetical protein
MKIKIVNVFQEEFEDTKGAIRNILNFGILTLLAHFINEGSSWSTSSTRRGTLVTNPWISYEKGKDLIVIMTCIQYYSTNEFSNFSFKCYIIMILSDILELSIVYCMIHRYCLYLIFFIVKCVILLFLIFCKKISLCSLRFT